MNKKKLNPRIFPTTNDENTILQMEVRKLAFHLHTHKHHILYSQGGNGYTTVK